MNSNIKEKINLENERLEELQEIFIRDIQGTQSHNYMTKIVQDMVKRKIRLPYLDFILPDEITLEKIIELTQNDLNFPDADYLTKFVRCFNFIQASQKIFFLNPDIKDLFYLFGIPQLNILHVMSLHANCLNNSQYIEILTDIKNIIFNNYVSELNYFDHSECDKVIDNMVKINSCVNMLIPYNTGNESLLKMKYTFLDGKYVFIDYIDFSTIKFTEKRSITFNF